MVLLLSPLFGGAACWEKGRGVGVSGETLLAFSPGCSSLISRLKALPLYMCFAESSNMRASLKLCLVCLSAISVSS